MSSILGRAIIMGCVLWLGGCAGSEAPSLATGTITPSRDGVAATGGARTFDCVRARQTLSALAVSLASLEPLARQQEKALPTTAVATVRRLGDPRGPGLAAVAQFEVERARYATLALVATQNNCPTKDYDETVQSATDKMVAFREGK
jgi:hypothetical protein